MDSGMLDIANSLVGGVVFLAVFYLINKRILRVGYEAEKQLSLQAEQIDLYRELWEDEVKKREHAETANAQLVVDLRSSIGSLSDTAKALQNANDLLTQLVHERGLVDRRRPQESA